MDAAFKTAPYPSYTTRELTAVIAEGRDHNGAMALEIERRAKVAAGDVSVMTDGERLRRVKAEKAATQYVIRSMTTTDMHPGPIEPYHIYLRPAGKRAGAWWSSRFEAQLFDTFEEAVAERNRLFANERFSIPQVAPLLDKDVPAYWEQADRKSPTDHRGA